MTNELKPCPFCGGEAELQNDIGHEDRLFYRAICADIDCQGHYCNLWSITPENAAEMWNTRYKRTCRNVYKEKRHVMDQCDNGFECSECGNVIEDYEHYGVKGTFNVCSKCGAEVING